MIDLLKYYRAEQELPRWYRDSTRVKNASEEQFLEFCEKCTAIFEIDDTALIYCEDRGNSICEVHFSMIRGTEVPITVMRKARDIVLREYNSIFGWVLKRNRGLRRAMIELEFTPNGVEMIEGNSHGKVLQWDCYWLTKDKVVN